MVRRPDRRLPVRIADAFHRAGHYDRHAAVQREVADRLAARILALGLPHDARILEIGCGTGFLGEGLVGRLPFAHYSMPDIAPGRVERARRRFTGTPYLDFAVADGAAPDLDGSFD